MKVVILAGGFGTRLAEETEVIPKPMVEIGGMPILWHIMKHYSRYGHNEFFIACGYKATLIKKYFIDYHSLSGDVTVEIGNGAVCPHDGFREDWTVHLVDTGLRTNTGGRLKRLQQWLKNEPFLLTYGDGVADVNLNNVAALHRNEGALVTLTAVRPPSRFGGILFDGNLVSDFTEKPQIGEGWINGGFMICQPEVLNLISGDDVNLEKDVLDRLAEESKLAAFRHEGFWQCMDTLRDKRLLEQLWSAGEAPWKTWT